MDWVRRWWGENKGLGVILGVGLGLLVGGGFWWSKVREPVQVEIIEAESSLSAVAADQVWVDVAGAVERPGVYQLSSEARVKDALLAAGGLAKEADRNFVTRYINLAQKITDGVKIYIPGVGEPVENMGEVAGARGNKINLNTASVAQLDQLWGVGEARAAAIIEARPFASVEELAKVVPGNVYERIKDEVSVF